MNGLKSLSISDLLKWNNEYVARYNSAFNEAKSAGFTGDAAIVTVFKNHRDVIDEYDQYEECQKILDLDIKAKKQKKKTDIRAFVNSNRNEIISANGGICFVCGFNYSSILEIHHVLPLKDGGNNSLDNLVALCPNCHRIVHNIERNRQKKNDLEWFYCNYEKWSNENIPSSKSQKMISLACHRKELR